MQQIGDSFPVAGIEIPLHDLTNPATALSCIRNNVTGKRHFRDFGAARVWRSLVVIGGAGTWLLVQSA